MFIEPYFYIEHFTDYMLVYSYYEIHIFLAHWGEKWKLRFYNGAKSLRNAQSSYIIGSELII